MWLHLKLCDKQKNDKKNFVYPFFVQVASIFVVKAEVVKSKYQFFFVHSKLIEVPFSGEAEIKKCSRIIDKVFLSGNLHSKYNF